MDQVPPVAFGELPEKPDVEICYTASEVLEISRALFETNPHFSESSDATNCLPPVREELAGLPVGLLEKVRAKEAAKKASEMFKDHSKDEQVKQLLRLPVLARLLRNICISEKKAALPQTFILKKVKASLPRHIALEVKYYFLFYLL